MKLLGAPSLVVFCETWDCYRGKYDAKNEPEGVRFGAS
jgi:hypothetical protein